MHSFLLSDSFSDFFKSSAFFFLINIYILLDSFFISFFISLSMIHIKIPYSLNVITSLFKSKEKNNKNKCDVSLLLMPLKKIYNTSLFNFWPGLPN